MIISISNRGLMPLFLIKSHLYKYIVRGEEMKYIGMECMKNIRKIIQLIQLDQLYIVGKLNT